MGILGIILIIVALLGLYGIFHITIYNKVQFLETKINHVEGIIDESLRTKYDLLARANEEIKEKLKNKKDYLKDLQELKSKKISNFDLDRKLDEYQSIIENLYNDYPELNDNENIKDILNNLKKANEQLTAGIIYYNKNTTILNVLIKKFPNNIIAKFHKIKIKPFFDGKDLTDDDIEDFKL